MKIAHHRRTVSVAVAIVALLALPGRASAAKPTVYSVRTGSSVTLSDSGGTPKTIESLTLARGSWTVTSNVTAVDFGTGDFVRCNLQQDGTVFDGGATTYVHGTAADLTNSGVLKTTATSTVISLVCTHDQDAPTTGQFYLDPGATLIAVEGGPIRVLTAAAGNGPTVVTHRTTTQTPIAPRDPTPVEQLHLGVGTWAFHVNLSIVSFSGFDFAACELFDRPGYGVIADQQVVVGDAGVLVSNVVLQGVRTYTKATTAKLECNSSETSGVYVDPGATIIATTVAPADLVDGLDAKAELSDTGGVTTTVFHHSMPAGAWRVSSAQTTDLADANGGIGGASDFVRCGLFAGNQPIDGSATVRITSGTDDGTDKQMIVESGTHAAKKAWTLRVECSHDTTIASDSHWYVFATSPVVAIQQGPISSSVT